ncbi:MAG: 4-alpha-glucanotransferase [Rhodothermales bacterium]
MNLPRCSGILLHITSLPSPFGIGDFGAAAYQFADFLAHTGQRVWQVLPLVPAGYGNSPYASPSTFAGNPLLISPDQLRHEGLLRDEDLWHTPEFSAVHVEFERVSDFKFQLLERAYRRFVAGESSITTEAFEAYCAREAYWIEDYALFAVLKFVHDGKTWTEWDDDLKRRRAAAMRKAREVHAEGIRMQMFWQFLFDRQWQALKTYCNERSISILGDLPIYVAHDSADVWANARLFHLDEDGWQTVVAGVPPDYFSETGQRWGNPIYRWDRMHRNGYEWWTRRMANIMKQVDFIRLDHFRGFEAFWQVPASEDTAVNGEWIDGPGARLFTVLEEHLGTLPVVAENLGVITPGVVALMQQFGFPGMAVLQFGFDSDASNEFLPHNYQRELVAYTGTHDNDTVAGWWFNDKSTQGAEVIARARTYARDYLDVRDEHDIHWALNRAVLASVARVAVLPLQDIIGLRSEGRMNTPGTVGDPNWGWRFRADQLSHDAMERLKHLTHLYGRGPAPERA